MGASDLELARALHPAGKDLPSVDPAGVEEARRCSTQIGAVVGSQVMQTIQVGTEATSGVVANYSNAYLAGAGAAVLGSGAALFVRSRAREVPPLEVTPAHSS